ncbi:IS256 family transposase [Kineococcus sp. NBC_00420]|uniref:IS256 family transposase n=1 Tax=Kineococcus sp. NBC_00420 TaxID=2903564 RepID=UPI002E23728E
MALMDQSALSTLTEALTTADDGTFMRRILQGALQALIDAEAEHHIGAGHHERSAGRTTQRNGTRDRLVATTAGDLALKIPKTRTGSFFPTLLHPRRRIDRALRAVVMEAYVHGVSTRKVDDLVEALGAESGISKSEVSRICADLDTEVATFTSRPLDAQATPYVFLDATYCKARVGGDQHGKGARVVSQAVVIATGVTADGHREVLGCNVGDAETLAFWKEFLTSLRERGLHGVQLVISDQHRGLVSAIEQSMTGASWQRCRVHFMRNVLSRVTKGQSDAVAAMVRTIFVQPTAEAVGEQVRVVADTLRAQFPAVAEMLDEAGPDVTAFAVFPEAHWKKIWSTNPIERLNREVKRRTDVVGIFPNAKALLRLAGCVLIEAHDEWQSGERRYLSEASMALLTPPEPTVLPTAAVTVNPDTVTPLDRTAALTA